MTTRLSSNLDSFKEVLKREIQSLDMSTTAHLEACSALEAKSAESVPPANNPSFQPELNKTHVLYQQWIKFILVNIQAQIDTEQELKALYQRPIDLTTLPEACGAIQHRLMVLSQQQKICEMNIKKFENRIVELTHASQSFEVDAITKSPSDEKY